MPAATARPSTGSPPPASNSPQSATGWSPAGPRSSASSARRRGGGATSSTCAGTSRTLLAQAQQESQTLEARAGAVFPGKVLFAAPFEGYGPTVVVAYAGRVLTLYAGLSVCPVNKDNTVTLGQVVGQASDKLYFAIRVENRPEDPAHWLR